MWHILARLIEPETAHSLALEMIRIGLLRLPKAQHDPILRTCVWGLDFDSPIGLAAGFDKNARCLKSFAASAFGFVEFGTVTHRPQPGNPKPRLFRYCAERSLINSLGFNNAGAERFLHNITSTGLCSQDSKPYGINIGKNFDSTDPKEDYVRLFKMFHGQCSYITINISSPNTLGLRNLQDKMALEDLLQALQTVRVKDGTPCLLKLSPDLDNAQLQDIAELVLAYDISGVILTNTTIQRRDFGLKVKGGMSGKCLLELADTKLATFYAMTGGKVPLIGVGGVTCATEAYRKIKLGASLVQLYTGLVYEGFGLIEQLNTGLAALLRADGYGNISEAVGVSAPR